MNDLVSFNYGNKADIPETKNNGSLYFATDSQEILLDIDDNRYSFFKE
jgi:hypothetical protein